MLLNCLAKTGFLALMLGAIATNGFLTACSSSAQNQAPAPSPATSAAGTNQQMDQGSMGDINHGDMKKGSMMDHAMMDLGPADAEFDLRFIDAMTPHHQGALAMAKAAQQKSKRPEMQKLAADMIKAQNQEIAQMQQWRPVWYPKAKAEPMAFNANTGQSMPMSQGQINGMMNMDLGPADDQFDRRFIQAMLPHHSGAVMMAQEALNKSKRPEIKKLAQAIISSQQAEMAQMQQWQQAWYKP